MLYLLDLSLKLHVCPLYRVLNVFSVSPTYVSSLLLSCLVTVAWYIMLSVWHCPSSGHVLFLRQLQFFLCCGSRCVVFVQYCFVVTCYYLLHVGHAAVAEFYCVSVQ